MTVESTSVAIELPDGPAAVVIAQDITARQQALEELRRSEARLRTFVENAPDGIFLIDGLTGKVTRN